MVIIKTSTYITRCPFSKQLIRPPSIICLFNERQFDIFKQILYTQLNYLPNDIIDIIIEKTGYKHLLHRFGHEKFAHWSRNPNKKLLIYQTTYNSDSSSESDND